MSRKLAAIASLIFAMHLCVLAQDKPAESDADKQKKQEEIDKRVMQLLDRSIAGADSLRLPENRAIVYGVAGDLYWKYDEKRARDLFRSAANELVAYNQEAERERRDPNLMDAVLPIAGAGARTEILPLVAKHDAELALELLIQTRPPKLAEAIARSSAPNTKTSPDLLGFDSDRQQASQELALEQRFALAAADANPERAIKLIKDSLAKGISPSILSLLQKLNKKDKKKATELADDVIKKVVETDLPKNINDMSAAMMLLQHAYKPQAIDPKEKPFAFTDQQTKDLANKIANTLLQPSRSMTSAMMLGQAMPMLDKLVPDKSAQLRQRQAENENTMPSELKGFQQVQSLVDPNSSAEEIAAQIPKLTTEYERSVAYSALAGKIGDIEDEARAKKLIDQIPDEKARNAAMDQFETARVTRTAKDGKLDDAKKMIGNITKKPIQVQRLVALALEFQKKGTEKDTETAKALMKDARALITEPAETSEQMTDLMEVIGGYGKVDPDLAFKLFEPVIGQFNELIEASAVLARFDPQNSPFRKGELAMRLNNQSFAFYGAQPPVIFRYVPQIQGLAKADLERMMTATDRFSRDDVRTIVRLYALQGSLRDEKDHSTQQQNPGFIF